MTVEDIPDADDVSRQLFEPAMRDPTGMLLWDNIFMFKKEHGCAESVVWRKYAPLIDDVHILGCAKQKMDREAGKKSTYIGAMTAKVERLRAIESAGGARFLVVHDPSNGQGQHHAHIQYDTTVGMPTKNDKAELKKKIKELFGGSLVGHRCDDQAA